MVFFLLCKAIKIVSENTDTFMNDNLDPSQLYSLIHIVQIVYIHTVCLLAVVS